MYERFNERIQTSLKPGSNETQVYRKWSHEFQLLSNGKERVNDLRNLGHLVPNRIVFTIHKNFVIYMCTTWRKHILFFMRNSTMVSVLPSIEGSSVQRGKTELVHVYVNKINGMRAVTKNSVLTFFALLSHLEIWMKKWFSYHSM